jgi:hypothetical protein
LASAAGFVVVRQLAVELQKVAWLTLRHIAQLLQSAEAHRFGPPVFRLAFRPERPTSAANRFALQTVLR